MWKVLIEWKLKVDIKWIPWWWEEIWQICLCYLCFSFWYQFWIPAYAIMKTHGIFTMSNHVATTQMDTIYDIIKVNFSLSFLYPGWYKTQKWVWMVNWKVQFDCFLWYFNKELLRAFFVFILFYNKTSRALPKRVYLCLYI